MTTAEQLLGRGAEILADPANWRQGDYGDYENGTGSFCAVGALRRAAVELEEPVTWVAGTSWGAKYTAARFLLGEAAREMYGPIECYGGLAGWNDWFDRQHAEVVQVFEKARALAGERGV